MPQRAKICGPVERTTTMHSAWAAKPSGTSAAGACSCSRRYTAAQPTTLPSPKAAHAATKPTVSSAGVITEVLAPDAPCRSASGRAGAIAHSPMMPTIASTPRWVAGLSVSVAATPMIAPPSPPAL